MLAQFRFARRVAAGLLAGVSLVTLSCAEPLSPVAVRPPEADANTSLLGGLLGSGGLLGGLNLLSCRPLPFDSETQTIGPAGGTINVGPHKFVVPPGALTSNVTITATAPSVPRREVRFEPEGLEFESPAKLTMSYEGCSLVSRLLPKKIVYTSDDLNPLELIFSIDFPLLSKVTGRIDHFSGYVVWQ